MQVHQLTLQWNSQQQAEWRTIRKSWRLWAHPQIWWRRNPKGPWLYRRWRRNSRNTEGTRDHPPRRNSNTGNRPPNRNKHDNYAGTPTDSNSNRIPGHEAHERAQQKRSWRMERIDMQIQGKYAHPWLPKKKSTSPSLIKKTKPSRTTSPKSQWIGSTTCMPAKNSHTLGDGEADLTSSKAPLKPKHKKSGGKIASLSMHPFTLSYTRKRNTAIGRMTHT